MVEGVVSISLPGQPPGCDQAPASGRSSCAALGEFVLGPENRLVEVAVRSVLDSQDNGYNPLVLHGPSGTGKSHLACGLAEAWKRKFRRRVVYATAVDFARELTDALETQALDEFRARYRSAGLLVLEDLGRLANKPAAQEELLSTLDVQLQAGNQVLVTASQAPSELPGILPGLRSRLAAGLTVPLSPPGLEARTAIVLQWAGLRGLNLAEPAVQILAEGLPVTVAELLGALKQLEMAARLECGVIGVEQVRRYLERHSAAQLPQLRQIALATARYFALKLSDLRSSSQRQAVVTARGVAMYVARQLTHNSLKQIGRYFGGRDHTTVLHGCRKTEDLQKKDPAIHKAIVQLQEHLRRRS